jgi:hypothetical protein
MVEPGGLSCTKLYVMKVSNQEVRLSLFARAERLPSRPIDQATCSKVSSLSESCRSSQILQKTTIVQ